MVDGSIFNSLLPTVALWCVPEDPLQCPRSPCPWTCPLDLNSASQSALDLQVAVTLSAGDLRVSDTGEKYTEAWVDAGWLEGREDSGGITTLRMR